MTRLTPETPVVVERADGETPGVLTELRVDGLTREAHQERAVVTTKRDGERVAIDTAAARVRPLDGPEADLVAGVVG